MTIVAAAAASAAADAAALCRFSDLWIDGRQGAVIGPMARAKSSRFTLPLDFDNARR